MAETAQVSDNANASFTAKNVTANSITVGSADTTLAQRSVSITECTIDYADHRGRVLADTLYLDILVSVANADGIYPHMPVISS